MLLLKLLADLQRLIRSSKVLRIDELLPRLDQKVARPGRILRIGGFLKRSDGILPIRLGCELVSKLKIVVVNGVNDRCDARLLAQNARKGSTSSIAFSICFSATKDSAERSALSNRLLAFNTSARRA